MSFLNYFFLTLFCITLSACQTLPSSSETAYFSQAADDNVQLAMIYLGQHQYSFAKAKLLKAQQQAPDSAAVWCASAYFSEQVGEIKTAEQDYQKALQLKPHDGAVLNDVGAYYCRRGDHSRAQQYFQQALQDPNYLTPERIQQNIANC